MNVPTEVAKPVLLVFSTFTCSTQQILRTVSALLMYSVRWTSQSGIGTRLPPKNMENVLLDEVASTQNAPHPDFECELSLFANGIPVIPAG